MNVFFTLLVIRAMTEDSKSDLNRKADLHASEKEADAKKAQTETIVPTTRHKLHWCFDPSAPCIDCGEIPPSGFIRKCEDKAPHKVNIPAYGGTGRPLDLTKAECWHGSDYRHCGCTNKCWVCRRDVIEQDGDVFAVVAPDFRTDRFSGDVIVHGTCYALLKERFGEPRDCLACPLASSHGEVGVYGLASDCDVCPACEVKLGYDWVQCARCNQQYLCNVADRSYSDEMLCDVCSTPV